MKTLVVACIAALGLLVAPVAGADPQPWCDWTPNMDMDACGLIVGVPASGQLVDGPGDWSTPEIRTK
ncbi:Uncharacterised protein [Mycobacteroides abscessus subsp. abscessus]|uniref:hypothetical protein n=1 Tax=Mycobacteroides abscessus TaxID=36809 RepID=UPI000926B1CB|nr:hypothetical protein [Mycobacteroides abscessus]MBE5451220.1 hypothetical protein [Mycobacteroides abscessus]SHW53057.1 Uncharacterised protein [Mycobacteroides abscessus subsp. abscessus]SHX58359.1 Uncharacterised protein [Mycobacteroides abscessus subsp. abscessus]SIE78583.1 Uncharacterised protein [Mycobacteroides abscessus subsp. abscessus]SII21778.1 Uncharacterised protein [Mycobacteroides abscessus subsp. abscessus]